MLCQVASVADASDPGGERVALQETDGLVLVVVDDQGDIDGRPAVGRRDVGTRSLSRFGLRAEVGDEIPGSADIAVISPAPLAPRRSRRGKPTSAEDPLWTIVGIADADAPDDLPTDVSSNVDAYLADAYYPLSR
jgi:hypothetical protein